MGHVVFFPFSEGFRGLEERGKVEWESLQLPAGQQRGGIGKGAKIIQG